MLCARVGQHNSRLRCVTVRSGLVASLHCIAVYTRSHASAGSSQWPVVWCGVVWSASVTLQQIFYCVTRISSHCLPSLVKLRTPSKWFPFITCNLSISQSHFNTNQMVGTRQTLVQCRDLDIKILTFYLCFHSLEQMAAKFEICTWNITVIFQLNRKYVYTVCLGSKPSNQPTRLWEKINYSVVNNLPIRNK